MSKRVGFVATWVFLAVAVVPMSPLDVIADDARPTTDELLGFSRYLSEDTDGYVSLLQMGRSVRDLAASNAWGKIAETPEVAAALAQIREALASDEIPPPVRVGLELLRQAGESEITFATSPELSREVLAFGRLALLSVAIFAPSPHAPDSPESRDLEARREPLRQQWTEVVPTIRIPSFVMAVRVRDAAKFDAFAQMMLEQGYRALLAELKPGTPPEVKKSLESAYSQVKLGNVSLARFRLRLGDMLPPGALDEALAEAPLDDAQRAAIKTTATDLTVEVHLGFLGEYLTLTVSSDDKFVRQIVDRYEGRSKETLAASQAFAPIRTELTPESLGIFYSNATDAVTELRQNFIPLLDSVTDPEFLALLGAPPLLSPTVQRVRFNVETSVFGSPLRQHGVLKLDDGLRQFIQTEYDRDPVPAATTPLATQKQVPPVAIGYASWRHLTLDGLWRQVHFMVEQSEAQLKEMEKQFTGNPEMLQFGRAQMAKLTALLVPIDEKLSKSLHGETAVILGEFTKFSVKDAPGPAIRDIRIPSAAVIVRSPAPGDVSDGIRELYVALVDLMQPPGRDRDLPVTLDVQDVGGIEAWVFKLEGPTVEGFEPHFARLGDAIVFSSSFDLTKQIQTVSSGRDSGIVTMPTHVKVQDLLPPTADYLSYVDGDALNRNLRATADGIFSLLENNREAFGISEKDQTDITQVKRFVQLGLEVARTFRGEVSSVVGEGRTDVLRDWIRFEDLQP